ncbi:hypothetical protein BDN71DRAFT_1593840 [Pleurotus eryngii]|uniref:Uncharacterized protein n=1 Tax=Pleurotus eryngii TaxID=5323 RepID=A0A9P6D2M7_PLEER|nr:hypothetical protein BDN71DRAFT_1593840 [Pleurotus eryngii]
MSDASLPPAAHEQLRERFYPTRNEQLHPTGGGQFHPTACAQQVHHPGHGQFQSPARAQQFQYPARAQQPAHGPHGQPFHSAAPLLLDHQQLRSVQFTATNILIEAFASGTLSSLNDEILRRRAEYHLQWHPNALDSEQARVVVSQTRCLVLSHIEEACTSITIRFAVLGVALEPICCYLQN